LSSVPYDCYDKKAPKAAYYTPDKSEQVVQKLKENAQIWTDLLSATGGALELSICSYHVAAWQFTSKGTPVLTTETGKYAGVTVTADKVSGSEYFLQYLSPYAYHKTLGHYKKTSGNTERTI
jgi:hypothetical protein